MSLKGFPILIHSECNVAVTLATMCCFISLLRHVPPICAMFFVWRR